MCKEGWLVRLGQEACMRVGELSEILEKGVEQKTGGEAKILKRSASWVKGWVP